MAFQFTCTDCGHEAPLDAFVEHHCPPIDGKDAE